MGWGLADSGSMYIVRAVASVPGITRLPAQGVCCHTESAEKPCSIVSVQVSAHCAQPTLAAQMFSLPRESLMFQKLKCFWTEKRLVCKSVDPGCSTQFHRVWQHHGWYLFVLIYFIYLLLFMLCSGAIACILFFFPFLLTVFVALCKSCSVRSS